MLFGVDARGPEVLQRATDRALAGLEIGDTVAGVDQHELGAGVDELRVERHRDHALAHVGRLARGQRFLLWRVDDELVRHRESARTVIDRGALVAADLVAVEARRLRPGLRHRGIGNGRPRPVGSRTDGGGACEQMAAIEIGHGEVPF